MLENLIATRLSQMQLPPNLPHRHLHALALQQEQQIITYVTPSPVQLYQTIAKLCPAQADLMGISHDEVAARIHFYSNTTTSQQQISPMQCTPPPEDQEAIEEQIEHVLEGFCAFSQPSIRNFLDEVHVEQESNSIWQHPTYFEQ